MNELRKLAKNSTPISVIAKKYVFNNIDDLNSRLDFIIKNKSFNREEQNIYTKLDKSNSNLIFQ